MGAGIIYSIIGNIYRAFGDIFKKISPIQTISTNSTKSTDSITIEIDNQFFAKVMDELEKGFKDKGINGKAIAMSRGDEAKANSLYIEMRAKELQDVHLYEQKELKAKAKEQQKIKLVQEQRITDFLEKLWSSYGSTGFIELYEDELKAEGFTKSSKFSKYHLIKSDTKFWLHVNYKKRELIITTIDEDVVLKFNLDDKLEYPTST